MENLYIGMVDTPGLFASIIRKYLKIPYVHVVLGLDPCLEEAYSVGRRFVEIPVFAGFEKENLTRIARKYPGAGYRVVRVACTGAQKAAIRRELEDTYQRRYQIHYAVLGLFALLANKPFHQESYYTCSSYLSRLLEQHGVMRFEKHFSLVTPKDFYERKGLPVVYEGEIEGLVRQEYEKECRKYPVVSRLGRAHILGAAPGQ